MEAFSSLLSICAGNSLVPGEFPAQRPVTRSFDVFFDLRPNNRRSKQWWGWWFETLSCPLWRQCNGTVFSRWVRPSSVTDRKFSRPINQAWANERHYISMALCKRDVTRLLTNQSYVSFVLSHRYVRWVGCCADTSLMSAYHLIKGW